MNAPAADARPGGGTASLDRWLQRRFGDDAHLHLVALRLVVCGLLLLGGDLAQGVAWAALPPAMLQPPVGAGWLVDAAQLLGGDGAHALLWGTRAVLVLAALGLGGAWSLATAALGCLVLLGLPQLSGTVRHTHHLVWLLALLALVGRPRPGLAAARGLATVWAMFACIYVFPGLHKLLNVGADWAFGDLVLRQARWKWLQVGRVPALATWLPTWAFAVGGAAVLLLELSWPLLALSRRAAAALVFATVGFHLAAAQLLYIAFPSLWLPLLTLLPWPVWARTLAVAELSPASGAAPIARASMIRLALAGCLLGAIAWPGIQGRTAAWPFACYPHFATRVGREMPSLRVRWTASDGALHHWQPKPVDGDAQRLWGQVWALALDAIPKRRCERQRAWIAQQLCQPRPSPASAGHSCGHVASASSDRIWLNTDPASHGRIVRVEPSCQWMPFHGEAMPASRPRRDALR